LDAIWTRSQREKGRDQRAVFGLLAEAAR